MKTFQEWWEENDGGVCGKQGCERAWRAAINAANTPPVGTPAESRYGRDVVPEPKPLAQYLAEYVDYEVDWAATDGLGHQTTEIWMPDKKLFEQALEAYQSTENVTIKIERIIE